MTAALVALIGVVLVAPFVWSLLVMLARRSAKDPIEDKHEKLILALMLAPVGVGVAFLCLPGEAVSAISPPLLDWIELPAENVATIEKSAVAATPIDWLLVAGLALLALYALGAARSAVALILAHMRLQRWVRAAQPAAELGVLLSDDAPSPLAAPNNRILFPRHLIDTLSTDQIYLIVAHERHHHARGDLSFYALLAWIDVLFWFNPFVRGQAQHCRLAAELDCDAAVTAAAPHMRRTYAQTLVTVLKHSAGDALQCAPAVFSHRAVGAHRMRILQIMKSDAATRKRAPWFAYAAVLALAAPLGASQLALAQSSGAAAPVASAAPVFSQTPVAGRISSGFGERTDPFSGARVTHAGIDIVAPEGTPVVAPAAGRVIRAVMDHEGYGNMIEIDHGGGYHLRYAQLSRIDVSEGQSVAAGQQIGRVGRSGRATGPHLHLEVWRDNLAWDPALVVPMP